MSVGGLIASGSSEHARALADYSSNELRAMAAQDYPSVEVSWALGHQRPAWHELIANAEKREASA